MTNGDPLMDDEQVGDAVAKYLEDNPELLQGIVPAHDLWPAIEGCISAHVIPMSVPPAHVARRSVGWIPMLIAASALVAASAGITYVLTTRKAGSASIANSTTRPAIPTRAPNAGSQSTTQVIQPSPSETAIAHNDVNPHSENKSANLTHERRSSAQLASHHDGSGSDDMRSTYDSEITTLHVALEARRGQLNPATVAIIEQNLRVIDDAINQSRAALAKDPNSRLLNDQLDRTLATKTSLLRAAALLPSA